MTITSNTAQWMSNRELANAISEASIALSDLRTDAQSNQYTYQHSPELHPAVREAVLNFNTLVTEQQRRNAGLMKLINA